MERITDKERIEAILNLPLKPLSQRIEEGNILGDFYFHTPFNVVFAFKLKPTVFKMLKDDYEAELITLQERYLGGDVEEYKERFIDLISTVLATALEVEREICSTIPDRDWFAMWDYNPYTVDKINFKMN